MEKSQVNEKYVLALVENSDATLSVRRMDIPSSEVPIAELEAMVDNPNRTVYDMSALINEILSMNKGVKPEIPPVLNSVRSTIEIFKKEEMNLERQIKFKEKRKLYYDKRKERLQAKMTFAEKIAHDKIFREKNPLYVKLEEEINELNQKVYNLQDKIRKRERVEERLTVCLKRTESIEEYKKEDHASE